MDLITLILGIFICLIGIIIGAIVTRHYSKKYSSLYYVSEKGVAKEKYKIIETFVFRRKNESLDIFRMVLEKSSIKNAQGFADFTVQDGTIKALHYAFINSCIHNILAPGKIVLKEGESSWVERAPSNKFTTYTIKSQLIADIKLESIPPRFRSEYSRVLQLKSEFDYPKTYTGPRYQKRLITFLRGVGIIKAETIYKSGRSDEYTLDEFNISEKSDSWLPLNEGNYWVYLIKYWKGPNKININE